MGRKQAGTFSGKSSEYHEWKAKLMTLFRVNVDKSIDEWLSWAHVRGSERS